MEPKFWHERWEAGEIGFHQNKTNLLLEGYWKQFSPSLSGEVFVPLCGKSKDMLWLAEQGHFVIGVELSAHAAEAFFAENSLSAKESRKAPFNAYQAGHIELLAGDFFNLSEADLINCQWVYDRAALIAFPPELRKQYAAYLQQVMPAGAAIFLVTLDYDPEEMKGPPFPVPKSEVETLFGDAFSIDCIDSREVLAMNRRFIEKGASWLNEEVYFLLPKVT
jgi:thiopurine S-methyltransferase